MPVHPLGSLLLFPTSCQRRCHCSSKQSNRPGFGKDRNWKCWWSNLSTAPDHKISLLKVSLYLSLCQGFCPQAQSASLAHPPLKQRKFRQRIKKTAWANAHLDCAQKQGRHHGHLETIGINNFFNLGASSQNKKRDPQAHIPNCPSWHIISVQKCWLFMMESAGLMGAGLVMFVLLWSLVTTMVTIVSPLSLMVAGLGGC